MEIEDDILNSTWDSVINEDHFKVAIKDTDNAGTSKACSSPSEEYVSVLSTKFGHKNFRPLQWLIIDALINKKRDVLAVMATGYGKSLCYQFPSVYLGGVTIVISPLISLMQDQILKLQVSDIPACLLGSAQTQKATVTNGILNNEYRLVYFSPEFCLCDAGSSLLNQMSTILTINLIAIDEAHCISQWGHDFRKQYTKLNVLRKTFPTVPILALTATATPTIQQEIIRSLHLLHTVTTFRSGFDRPNLMLRVFQKSKSILEDLRHGMTCRSGQWRFTGPTIIYCLTRANTEKIAEILTISNINCVPYHAGLKMSERQEAHERFMLDKVDVVVATIAFGMGIDKPDIRTVIHYGCSGSIEAYYQEVGRAGRDGLPSNCLCFYSASDFRFYRNMAKTSRSKLEIMLAKMTEYLESDECRRNFLLNYFEGIATTSNVPHDKCCDNCLTKKRNETFNIKYKNVDETGLYDFTQDAFIFLSAVDSLQGRFGVTKYLLFLKGSHAESVYKFRTHKMHGAGKHKSDNWWKAICTILKKRKYIEEKKVATNSFNVNILQLTQEGCEFITSPNRSLKLKPSGEILKLLQPSSTTSQWSESQNKGPSTSTASVPSTREKLSGLMDFPERSTLYKLLLKKRAVLSIFYDCMPYVVASNTALVEMAKLKPKNLLELKQCKVNGFTEAKLYKFGEDFLETIQSFTKANDTDQFQQSIREALLVNPLSNNIVLTQASQAVYNLFTNGETFNEIITTMGLSQDAVGDYLIDNLKMGRSIKLSYFGVKPNILHAVQDIIDPGTKDLSDFKNLPDEIRRNLPQNISKVALKAIFYYQKIRNHLKKLSIQYIDFDDINITSNNTDLDDLISACRELQDDDINEQLVLFTSQTPSQSQTSVDNYVVPEKKQKLNVYSVLDSPPRNNEDFSTTNELHNTHVSDIDLHKESTHSKEHRNKVVKKLPPWLMTKKS